jgi:hypothetical protein
MAQMSQSRDVGIGEHRYQARIRNCLNQDILPFSIRLIARASFRVLGAKALGRRLKQIGRPHAAPAPEKNLAEHPPHIRNGPIAVRAD